MAARAPEEGRDHGQFLAAVLAEEVTARELGRKVHALGRPLWTDGPRWPSTLLRSRT